MARPAEPRGKRPRDDGAEAEEVEARGDVAQRPAVLNSAAVSAVHAGVRPGSRVDVRGLAGVRPERHTAALERQAGGAGEGEAGVCALDWAASEADDFVARGLGPDDTACGTGVGAGGSSGAPRALARRAAAYGDEEEEEGEGDGEEAVDEDTALDFDSDGWIRRQKAANVTPEGLLGQLGVTVSHASSADELWQLAAVLISQLRTRMLPRQRLGGAHSTLDDAVRLLSTARSVVVVSGAGISVSAGIPDFRSANGVYQMVEERFNLPDPQALFDIHYFANDPLPFFAFAKNIYPGVFQPTRCHRFIRALEARGRLLRNYTQNIDTLEKVTGIRRKVTCHGSFETASCLACKRTVSCDEIRPQIASGEVPRCGQCEHHLGILKPDIVFFGESLGEGFERHIQRDLPRCDALVVVGSSMRVQPVAAIPAMLPPDVPQILINRELVLQPHRFDIELLGDCDVIVAELARRLGWGSLDPPSDGTAGAVEIETPCVFRFEPPSRYLFAGAIEPLSTHRVRADGDGYDCSGEGGDDSGDEQAGAGADGRQRAEQRGAVAVGGTPGADRAATSPPRRNGGFQAADADAARHLH